MTSDQQTTTQPSTHAIPNDRRAEHQRWLLELTQIPTGTGKENRVVAWIDRWLEDRSAITKHQDPHGNFELRLKDAPASDHPIYFTAHLDHPGFAVDQVESQTTLIISFRGGVMDDYFPDARVRIHLDDHRFAMGTIGKELKTTNQDGKEDGKEESALPFKRYSCTLDEPTDVEVGALGNWDLPDAKVVDDEFGGILHTNACDDLAAVAAALSALDELSLLQQSGIKIDDIRVLFTLAEEVGFIGAIGASRDGFMPKGSTDHRARELARLPRLPNPRRPDRPCRRSHQYLLTRTHRSRRQGRRANIWRAIDT